MDKKIASFKTEISIDKSSIVSLNPQFSLCDVLVAYPDDNRNTTNITKDVFKNALPTIYGIPIVGAWSEEDKDFTDHGEVIEIKNGDVNFKVLTKPYGFVTKEAVDNAEWVEILHKDGVTKKEYLKLSGCILWTARYEEAQKIIDDGCNQSMEVEFTKGHYREDGYFVAEEMIFSALCIIAVEPCFEMASIGRHYAFDKFKQEFQLMLDEYKNSQTGKKEDGNLANQTMDMVAVFARVQEVFAEMTFRASTGKHYPKYEIVSILEYSVNVIDREDGYKAYSIPYLATQTDNSIIVNMDFEKKEDRSIVVAEKNEYAFDLNSEIQKISKDVSEYNVAQYDSTTIQNLKGEITQLTENYNVLQDEKMRLTEQLGIFEKEKGALAKAAHKNSIDAVVGTWANTMGKDADFLEYASKVDYSKPIETVEAEIKEIHYNFMLKTENKSKCKFSVISTGIINTPPTTASSLVEEYGEDFAKFLHATNN